MTYIAYHMLVCNTGYIPNLIEQPSINYLGNYLHVYMNKLTVIQGGMAILLYNNHSDYSIIAACIAVRVSIS